MTQTWREVLLLGILLVVMACAAVWSGFIWLEARSAHARALVDATEARKLGAEIDALRTQPQLVSDHAVQLDRLSVGVEQAVQSVGVDPRTIVRIDPTPPRRIDGKDYVRHAVDVRLRGLNLAQAGASLSALEQAGGRQQHVVAARLSSDRNRSASGLASDVWDVEATLAYLVFAPSSEGATTSGATRP